MHKLQIINGAQTVGTLAKTKPHDDVCVLFRLTRTGDVNIEKSINRNIIEYNNTQNLIKLSDFRSNDRVQLWLEMKFKETRNLEVLPAISYLRKRGQRAGAHKGVTLEEFAKVRYAYKY